MTHGIKGAKPHYESIKIKKLEAKAQYIAVCARAVILPYSTNYITICRLFSAPNDFFQDIYHQDIGQLGVAKALAPCVARLRITASSWDR